jgi:hypothetical protein
VIFLYYYRNAQKLMIRFGGRAALFYVLYRNTTEIERYNVLFYNTFTIGVAAECGRGG